MNSWKKIAEDLMNDFMDWGCQFSRKQLPEIAMSYECTPLFFWNWLNSGKSFVLPPLSNSYGAPIISPRMAPYMFHSSLTLSPLWCCYYTGILMIKVACRATLCKDHPSFDEAKGLLC